MDTLEEEVHTGEYNVKVLKKISKLAEKFYLNMENDESDEEPGYKFFPKVYEIESTESDDEFFISHKIDKKEKSDDEDESNFIEDDFDKKFKQFMISTQNAEKKEPQKEDKLFADFLNNDISMEKYNYLKHNINNNVEKFCTSCYVLI